MVKVGDKVRSLVDETDLCSNKIYEVVSVGRHSVNVEDDAGDEHFLFEDEYEPVAVADSNGNQPKFKVGDRVRALDSCGGGGFVAGDEYIVSRVYEDFSGKRISVEVDSAGSKTNGWGVQHFELVDAPLTIRAGRYYKTRDGRKVGPAVKNHIDDTTYPWNVSHDGGFHGYTTEGESCLSYRGADIIAEWGDEPALDTSTAGFTVPLEAPEFGGAESKFKVGDRVAYADGKTNGLGEIIEVLNGSEYDYIVRVESKDAKYAYYPDGVGRKFTGKDLRLVAEATTAQEPPASIADIVRRLERLESAMWQRAA